MEMIIPFIILAIYVAGLRGRVKELEQKVQGQSSMTPTVAPATQQLSKDQVSVSDGVPPVVNEMGETIAGDVALQQPVAQTDSFEPRKVPKIIEWIKQDFLVKLGALLLLIAFGWFVSYAFANNWIGPIGRITLGILAGALLVIGGQFRIRNFKHQGGIFMVVGSTVILLTIFAAREIYDMFNPLIALIIMFFSVAYVALASVQYNSRALAIASLILASIAPMFTASPSPELAGLFTYLLVVVVGALWIVYLTGWAELSFTALIIVALYGFPFAAWGVGGSEADTALLFSFIFTALFFATNIMSMTHKKDTEIGGAHFAVAIGTGIYLILWILAAAGEQWQVLFFVAWMLVFSFGTFAVFKTVQRHEPFYIYGATSLALLAIATAVQLSGNGAVLVIAYTLEISAILFVTYIITGRPKIASRISYLYIAPIFLSLPYLEPHLWQDKVIDAGFFAIFILMMTLFVVANFFREQGSKHNFEELSKASATLTVIGGMYVISLIWLVSHGIMQYDVATTISLVIYIILGLILYFQGRTMDNKIMRVAGSFLIGGVVLRLLFIDVWDMELAGRIVTFFIIGAMLMATSFLAKKKSTHE